MESLFLCRDVVEEASFEKTGEVLLLRCILQVFTEYGREKCLFGKGRCTEHSDWKISTENCDKYLELQIAIVSQLFQPVGYPQ